MMNKFLYIPLLVIGLVACGCNIKGEAATPAAFYTNDGKRVSMQQAVEKFRNYDVIVFGEYHDNTRIHEMEIAFMQALYQKEQGLTLSLEMIERDVQPQVNQYLKGEITETEFITQTRPWKNYMEDYRPMVNFAKENGLDVIASNIPRYLAAQYARTGTLDAIAADKKQYLPKTHQVLKNQYYSYFKNYMMSGQMGMKLDEAKMERFYQAQSLKDDTMAESIAQYLKQNPQKTVFHVQGEFHSRQRLGVVEKLQALAPDLKIGVISAVYDDINGHKDNGDLLLVVKK